MSVLFLCACLCVSQNENSARSHIATAHLQLLVKRLTAASQNTILQMKTNVVMSVIIFFSLETVAVVGIKDL